jgi:hypothetical protein
MTVLHPDPLCRLCKLPRPQACRPCPNLLQRPLHGFKLPRRACGTHCGSPYWTIGKTGRCAGGRDFAWGAAKLSGKQQVCLHNNLCCVHLPGRVLYGMHVVVGAFLTVASWALDRQLV